MLHLTRLFHRSAGLLLQKLYVQIPSWFALHLRLFNPQLPCMFMYTDSSSLFIPEAVYANSCRH
jgi:hypothetical protein